MICSHRLPFHDNVASSAKEERITQGWTRIRPVQKPVSGNPLGPLGLPELASSVAAELGWK